MTLQYPTNYQDARLSETEAASTTDIYGFRQGKRQIPKDYKRFPDAPDVLSTLGITYSSLFLLTNAYRLVSDNADHARTRKLIAHVFSETALGEQMPLLKKHIIELISQLEHQISGDLDRKVDLSVWYTILAFDIVTELSLGEPLNAVQGSEKHAYIKNFVASCRS